MDEERRIAERRSTSIDLPASLERRKSERRSPMDEISRRRGRNIGKRLRKEPDAPIDFVAAIFDRQRRFRRQNGVIVEYKDGIYVRFYRDNVGERYRDVHRLGDLGMAAQDIERARAAFMNGVNAQTKRDVGVAEGELARADAVTIGQFWRSHYLPSLADGRWSTRMAYEKVWRLYCKDKLDNTPIKYFGVREATKFLKTFVRRLNKNSLAHVKSFLSGLFEEAVLQGYIDLNPWHLVKLKKIGDLRAAEEQEAYSIEERDAILRCIPRLDAKVFFGLCSVLGLRPSEANCVRWENIKLDAQPYPTLSIKEAASYGHMDKTKTEKSKRPLLVVSPLLELLTAYAAQRGFPKEGLLFMRAKTREVIDPSAFPRLHIKGHVEKAGLVWKGMYAGRHGVAKRALDTPGVSVQDVAGILGNQPKTVMASYSHPDKKRVVEAQLALAAVEKT